MKSLLAFFVVVLSGCGTVATSYAPLSKRGGYADEEINDWLVVSRFYGNAFTSSGRAEMFSYLHAIEYCKENSKPVVRVLNINDLSMSKDVVKSSSYTYKSPTKISGTATTSGTTKYNSFSNALNSDYNTNLDATVSGGNQSTHSSSWVETWVYPHYETVFFCTDKVKNMGVNIQNIEAGAIQSTTQDFLGAVLINDIPLENRAYSALQLGDVILKIENIRVQNTYELSYLVTQLGMKSNNVNLTILRKGAQIKVKQTLLDGTRTYVENQKNVVNQAC